jgi:hypothetical protein
MMFGFGAREQWCFRALFLSIELGSGRVVLSVPGWFMVVVIALGLGVLGCALVDGARLAVASGGVV